MGYAYVEDDVVQYESSQLPMNPQVRQDTGEVVATSLKFVSKDIQEATGWYEVQETVSPEDTPTTTFNRTLSFDGTAVTEVWTERPKTQQELDAYTYRVRGENAEIAIRGAVTELKNYRQMASNRTDAQNMNQANNQLQATADAVSLICSTLIKILEFEILPDLRDVADDLG